MPTASKSRATATATVVSKVTVGKMAATATPIVVAVKMQAANSRQKSGRLKAAAVVQTESKPEPRKAQKLASTSKRKTKRAKHPRWVAAVDVAALANGDKANAKNGTGTVIKVRTSSRFGSKPRPRWEAKFAILKKFVDQKGHARVPFRLDTEEFPKLGGWVTTQRQAYRHEQLRAAGLEYNKNVGRLNPEQIRKLESLGFEWVAFKEPWNKNKKLKKRPSKASKSGNAAKSSKHVKASTAQKSRKASKSGVAKKSTKATKASAAQKSKKASKSSAAQKSKKVSKATNVQKSKGVKRAINVPKPKNAAAISSNASKNGVAAQQSTDGNPKKKSRRSAK